MTTRQLVPGRSVMARSPSFTPVRSGLLQRKCACGGTPGPTGECEECRKKRQSLQRKTRGAELGTRNDSGVPPIVHEVLRSPGQPLDADTRAFMEPRFDHDFSQVRVHTDARAAESARAVNALAYTIGSDVVFAAGHYAAAGNEGRRLLAHELTHVVQQNGLTSTAGLAVGPTADQHEREAEQAAIGLMANDTFGVSHRLGLTRLQRQPDIPPARVGAAPTSSGRCYTCQIPGGIGVCCYGENAPMDEECFQVGTRIIDACKGPPASCLQEAQCATCQCLGRKFGEQACQCTGIV